MTRSKFVVAVAVANLLASIGTARAESRLYELPLRYAPLKKGQLQTGLGFSYFKTTESFEQNSSKVSLIDKTSLQSLRGLLFVDYSPLESFTIFGRFEQVSNTLNVPATPTATTFSNSVSSLGDQVIGFRYSSVDTSYRLMAEGFAQFPLYSRLGPESWSQLQTNSPMPVGTGVAQFGAAVTGELPLAESLFAGVGLGYTMRVSGFSNLFPYRVYLKYDAPRGLFGRVGLVGHATAGEDRFNPLSRERSRVVIAGSQAYNAINPTALKADLAAGAYLGSTVFINAGAQIPLAGRNTPAEPVYIALVGFDFGGDGKDPAKDPRSEPPTDEASAEEKLKPSKQTRKQTPAQAQTPRPLPKPQDPGFETYTISSKIVQANNQLQLLLIDKGRSEGIKPGEELTVFAPDTEEGIYGAPIARAKVTQVGPTRSKLRIMQYYKKQRIEEGFVVRRPVR